jgi:hypothetical protein
VLANELEAWLLSRANRQRYHEIGGQELAASRRSDTVFIFGSGASLNAIPDHVWRYIGEHDTMGFNWFVHERFVRCDYHLIREIPDDDFNRAVWKLQLRQYFELIGSNPCFGQTIFLVQSDFRALSGNRSVGLRLLPTPNRVFFWSSVRTRREPGRNWADGLTHGHGTLQECVNAAFIMGWKRIVLAGVDLYDRRYFWLRPDEKRTTDPSPEPTHKTALAGVVSELKRWADEFHRSGVELLVQNPKSLLAKELPVWDLRPSDL